MRLIQFEYDAGRAVGLVAEDGKTVATVRGAPSTYSLAMAAIEAGRDLAAQVDAQGLGERLDYARLLEQGRVRPPLTHADPAHCYVTGTGLTHLGSAEARDRMHAKLKQAGEDPAADALTDSMKMFKLGIEGGRSSAHAAGVQPEWFYKGDGGIVVAPGAPLPSPDFALDGGEEPEIVGLYVIGPGRRPWRLGFALGNEFSDHVTERQNYLYLAHSKLRPCAVGPELRVGTLPPDLHGTSRILRGGATLWEKPFLTGEANMCHDIANLEYHHFKYAQFLREGDVHLHFFGTGTLSFVDGVKTQEGDVFEIGIPQFGAPLRNPLGRAAPAFTIARTGVL